MAKLVLVQGTGAGKEYSLGNRETVLGRQPDMDVHLDAPEVSRRHARILTEQDRFFVEDLGSSNGTFLNSTRLEGKVELHARDQIKVGPYLLLFEMPTAPEPGLIIHAEVPAHTSNLNLFKQDASRKLQVVLEIAQQLANSLDLEELFSKLLDQLLQLFPQADRGFILMREGEHIVMRAMQDRRESRHSGPVYSRTVVTRVLEEGIGIVAQDARMDQRFVATQTLKAMGIRSFLCVPFKTHDGRPLGVLQLDRFGAGAPFTPDDLYLLTAVSLQASIVLENAALHADLLQQERIKRDLALAREIQEGFLPQEFPSVAIDRVELFGKVYPARDVSGDFYDYFTLDEHRLAFTIADVSGKGIPAALFMIAVRTLGRHLAMSGASPAAMLQTLNDALAADNPAGLFVTMVFGTLNTSTGEVVLASGGHPPALLRNREGHTEVLSLPTGRLLGFSPGQLPLSDVQMVLKPGETLILYTDGITEAFAPDHQNMFGSERFVSEVSQLPQSQPLDAWAEQLKAVIDQFTHTAELHDDITLLFLRRP